ncbi:hypothetical protein GCM10027261_25070 [Geodermatophilus arenarius]|uniref:DUF6308 family protein n=1 Tax=Geodermatophilus arenarius TaxID=1137990 RepID=A0ABV9LJ55_9ACTN
MLTLDDLLRLVDDPRAVDDLVAYYEPGRPPRRMPTYSGSRFEFLAGGGDRPDTADRITYEDLVAVTMLEVDVPGDVALALLEGDLGLSVSDHLSHMPTDVAISDPRAVELFATASHARVVWDLLEEPHGMGWVITGKLLARKRPRLIPVYDRVVRCAFGRPAGVWNWLLGLFAEDGGVLGERLSAAREASGIPSGVTDLRTLDVITWMRHHREHTQTNCAGLRLPPTQQRRATAVTAPGLRADAPTLDALPDLGVAADEITAGQDADRSAR